MACGWSDGLKDDLSQCGVTRDQQRERTPNGVQMCSLIHVTHVVLCVLVLVGVGRVTVVHIGHEEVLVVKKFLRSHFCRDFLYQEMYSLHILHQCSTSCTVNVHVAH